MATNSKPKAKNEGTTVWTAECPITYVHFDTPREPQFEGQKAQYECTVLVDNKDDETLQALREATVLAMTSLKDTDPKKQFKPLFRIGDEVTDREGNPIEDFKGKRYFTVKSPNKPKLYVSTEQGLRPAQQGEITNWSKGQLVFSLNAYDFDGGKGFYARLIGFCKTASGNGQEDISAEEMFGDLGTIISTTTPQVSQAQAQAQEYPDVPF